MTAWVEIIIWALSLLLVAVGFVGVFVPILPGPFLILAGVLLHKIFLPQYLSWATVVIIFLGAVLAILLDWICMVFGVKKSGASRYGIMGAGVGFLVGGILFNVIGILVGPIVGAVAGEYLLARRKIKEASSSGIGAGLGILLGTVARLVIAILMIFFFLLDCFVY